MNARKVFALLIGIAVLAAPAWAVQTEGGADNGLASLPALTGALIQTNAAPDWYKDQPALQLIHLADGQKIATGKGVIIADIDSSVDVNHPALRGHLIAGEDFVGKKSLCATVTNQSSASFLDQSSASFLDQSSASFLDQSSASFLDQSSASFLDQDNAAHGHGTAVAGILAAIAPDAMIMPLRAFDDSGCADTVRVAQAVRYAVANGAQVINMSFSVAGTSANLRAALDQAAKANVLLVSAAGNLNTMLGQAPASFSNVIGTAATDLDDKKTPYTNYGPNAKVSAPGANIVSAYPGGFYAVYSGTSFASPMVAGEAALLRSINATGTISNITAGAVNIDAANPNFVGLLGAGRIDVARTVTK